MENGTLESVKRIGTGLSFILAPVLMGAAFAAHPNLLSLDVGGEVSNKVAEFHGNPAMHFGHFLMLLSVPLLIVVALKLKYLLENSSPWLGFIGCVVGCFGAILLAVDKTALCLVMSAFESVPDPQYDLLLPGIEALFNFEGYLAILYLLPLLPLGFLILGVGLYRDSVLPRWQSAALIIAMLGLGVSAAVDIDVFGLVATVLLAACLIPSGYRIIKGDYR